MIPGKLGIVGLDRLWREANPYQRKDRVWRGRTFPPAKVAFLSASVVALLAIAAQVTAQTLARGTSHTDHRSTRKLVFPTQPATESVTKGQVSADAYLAANAAAFGLPADLSNLKLARTKESLLGRHYYYQQYIGEVPVDKAKICVSVGLKSGHPYKVYNNTYPVESAPPPGKARISSEEALDIAWADLRVHGKLFTEPRARLVYVPKGRGFQLVYKTDTDVEKPFGYWEHTIDARTGEIESVRPRQITCSHGKRKPVRTKMDFGSYKGPVISRTDATSDFLAAKQTAAEAAAKRLEAAAMTNGTALVFDPDPRTALADDSLVDGDPGSEFDPAYVTRTLLGITVTGGVHRLEGPWCTIKDIEAPNTAPSTDVDGNWTAKRGTNAFNDVMTYFHIDQNQRYVQGLGYTGAKGIQELSIEVDSDGVNGGDNSYFAPGGNYIVFGHGGVDDNEDADVILHEYWHALQDDINPSWSGNDTGAIGEGFGDFWAASYSYVCSNGATYHPEWAFTWDGHNIYWDGRVMNITGQYNPAATYPAHTLVGGINGDELWGTPIFQAFVKLMGLGRSRAEMDTIMLECNYGLGAGVRMPDMASSVISAAELLYPAGPHAQVYHDKFHSNNIVQLADPVLLFPTGGEHVVRSTQINVRWQNGDYPTGQVAVLQYTASSSVWSTNWSDDIESGTAGWATGRDAGAVDWAVVSSDANSPTNSWHGDDPTSICDFYVITPELALVGECTFSFWHKFNFEDTWDGGVVELTNVTSGGAWTDLGPLMTENGYNSAIDSYFGNPLGDVAAFTGTGGWYRTTIDLSGYAGETVKVRFRIGTDDSATATPPVGWWVDDILVKKGPNWTSIGSSDADATNYLWTTPSATGTDYAVRLKLTAPGWTDTSWTKSEAFTVLTDDTDGDGFDDDTEVYYGTSTNNAGSFPTPGPVWWYAYRVIATNVTVNDYAAANAGQLKWLAQKAYVAMSNYFGTASDVATNGAPSAATLVGSFTASNNYHTVNLGQVKYVAQPFYNWRINEGVTNAYPWAGAPQTNDCGAANIGQVKNVFSFSIP